VIRAQVGAGALVPPGKVARDYVALWQRDYRLR